MGTACAAEAWMIVAANLDLAIVAKLATLPDDERKALTAALRTAEAKSIRRVANRIQRTLASLQP